MADPNGQALLHHGIVAERSASRRHRAPRAQFAALHHVSLARQERPVLHQRQVYNKQVDFVNTIYVY